MSDAAEHAVRTCTHPKMKGGTRDLAEAIARRILEGQTTTPVIAIDDLAIEARMHRRTVLSRLEVLVDIGVVQVIDGGRGRIARYRIMDLAGARPITDAPLPLVGAAAPRRLRPRPASPATPTLFDEASGEEPAIKEWRSITRWSFNVWRSITRWRVRVITRGQNVWRSITRSPKRVAIDHTLPVSYIDRARDVHTYEEERETHAPPDATSPPCRLTGTAHAWCHGRVHVPMDLHRDFLRKAGRLAGETDADVERALVAFYVRRSAALDPQQPITENDFQFWRRHYVEEFASAAPNRAAPIAAAPPRPRSDAAMGGSTCPHDPMCARRDDCVERTLAEARAERQRRSG